MLVAQHLDFDVTRIGDELLDEHTVVAEARFRLRAGARKTLGQFGAAMSDAHALAAAARGGLDHDRVADLVGDPFGLLVVFDDPEVTRHGRDLGRSRRLLALDLIAHGADRFRVRPDEDDAGVGESLGESLTFGEKAVARMHGLGAGRLAGGDDLVDEQIALRGRWGSDQDGFVGHLDMQRVAIGLGINRDGGDAHTARGR